MKGCQRTKKLIDCICSVWSDALYAICCKGGCEDIANRARNQEVASASIYNECNDEWGENDQANLTIETDNAQTKCISEQNKDLMLSFHFVGEMKWRFK